MADVGRSTLEHGESVRTHVLEAFLQNWGAWMASMQNPHAMQSIKGCPVSRRYMSRYAAEHPRSSRPFDEDDAKRFDTVIAANLDRRDVEVMVCAYALQASSRDAARRLTMMKLDCSHTTYRSWLGFAVKRLADVLEPV